MGAEISEHSTTLPPFRGLPPFLYHYVLMSVVAPVLGVLISTKLGRFFDTPRISQDELWKDFLLSVIGTVLLSPLVVPSGIVTYFLCRFGARKSIFGLAWWAVAWMCLGGLFGFEASAATHPMDVAYTKGICVPVGVTEGFIIGLILRKNWMRASTKR
jgi:hypothetical protein